jgi:hypothetical protein
MQLSKQKPLDWFTELFTIGYLKAHTFSTIFIYAILVIAISGLISTIKSFTTLALGVFIIKLIFTLVVIYLIKLFFEKYRI